MPHPCRRQGRRLVGRPVAERIRIEDDDIGVGPHCERALPRGTAAGRCQHAGGKLTRAPDELRDAEDALADQSPKGAGEGPRPARVRDGVRRQRPHLVGGRTEPGQGHRVAGHHGVLVHQRRARHRRVTCLRLIEEVHDAEAPRVSGAQATQVLDVTHPLIRRRVDEVRRPEAPLCQPVGREERRPDRRHPGAVGIGLRGDDGPSRRTRSTKASTRSTWRSEVLFTWQ